MMIIRYKNFFIGLSALLIVVSGGLIATRGLSLGIEFAGGALLEMSYEEGMPDIDVLRTRVEEQDIQATLQPFGENILVRSRDLTENERVQLISSLSSEGAVGTVERFNSIGPSFGAELKKKAIVAVLVVMIALVIFVAHAFRHIAKNNVVREQGLSSWHFGFAAVLALVHDVLIPAGVFALLGKEVDSLFVVGLLSILGLSVNDTIVVFDRIRENLIEVKGSIDETKLETLVGASLTQTVARSIATSLTLLVVLIALWVFGPEATKNLALILGIGTLVGTYSSLFFASPMLLVLRRKR